MLLHEEKLAVVPGNAFGDSGEGFLRISYAYSLENLKKAIASAAYCDVVGAHMMQNWWILYICSMIALGPHA